MKSIKHESKAGGSYPSENGHFPEEERQQPKQAPCKRYWDPKEAATYCGLNKVTILRRFRDGSLRGHKLGARTIRFRREDLDDWMSAARV